MGVGVLILMFQIVLGSLLSDYLGAHERKELGIPWEGCGQGQVSLVEQRSVIYIVTQTIYPRSRNAYYMPLSYIVLS